MADEDDAAAQDALADLVEQDAAEQDTADTAEDDEGDAEQLGDPGKRALDRMKGERNAARKEREQLLQKLKEYEDQGKSETQRLQEAAEEAKGRAAKAEVSHRKLQVALDRAPEGASLTQIKAVAKRVTGETDEDLEADADELFALLAPKTEDKTRKPAGKPRETLSGGGDPEQEPDIKDPRKLADLIGRR